MSPCIFCQNYPVDDKFFLKKKIHPCTLSFSEVFSLVLPIDFNKKNLLLVFLSTNKAQNK